MERRNFIKQQGGQDPYGSTMDQLLKKNAQSDTPDEPVPLEVE